MAISTVQTNQNSTGSSYLNNLSLGWNSNTLSGNFQALIIVTSNPSTTAVSTVTDTVGNSWTKLNSFAGTGNCSLDFWYVQNAIGGTTPTVTITLAANQFNTISAVMREYSGLALSSVFDKDASNVESSFVTSHATGTTATTTQANELCIAGYVYTNSGITLTVGGSYTTVVNQSNSTQFTGMGYSDLVVSSTGTQSATFSSGATSLEGIGYIATFKQIASTILTVSVFDSSAVTESLTIQSFYPINVNDSSTVTDTVDVLRAKTRDVSATNPVFDSSTVTDVLTQVIIIDQDVVNDSSAVTENTTVRIAYLINVNDSSAVTESLTVTNIYLPNVNDSSTVTDVLTQILDIYTIHAEEGFPSSGFAYWKFDDGSGSTVTDSIGSNNLTWQGTLGSQWGTGLVNGDGVFNGTDNYARRSASTIYGSSPYSLSFWIKGAAQSNMGIYSEGSSSTNTPVFAILSGTTTTSVAKILIRNDGNTQLVNNEGASVILNNQWNHVVWVDNGGVTKLYVNNAVDGNNSLFQYTPSGTFTLNETAIGALWRQAAGNFFSGSIDEFAIWNKALSATEVADLYNSRVAIGYNGQTGQVTESLTPKEIYLVNVSDSSAVTESTTVVIPMIPEIVNDSSAVTDSVTIEIVDTEIISDASTVTDTVQISIVNNISVSDSSTVTDSITIESIDTEIISDASTVTDTVTIEIIYFVNVFDSSAVTDVITPLLIDTISVFDASTVTENVVVTLGSIPPVTVSVGEDSAVTENVSAMITENISVFDSSAVTDVLTVNIIYQISVFDSSTVTDILVAEQEMQYDISVFDSSTVTDNIQTAGIDFVSVYDTSRVSEFLGYFPDQSTVTDVISMSEVDNGSIADSTQATDVPFVALTQSPNVFDASTVTDTPTLNIQVNANVFDSSTVTESVVVARDYFLSVFDTSTVTDVVTPVIPVLKYSVFDSSTVTDVVIIEPFYFNNAPLYYGLDTGEISIMLGFNKLPMWNGTVQRPSNPPIGAFGFNYDDGQMEIWDGKKWWVRTFV